MSDLRDLARLHLLYFTGYAMWHHLAAPFLSIRPGVVVDEIEPWTEGGEPFRRLRVATPPELDAHHPAGRR